MTLSRGKLLRAARFGLLMIVVLLGISSNVSFLSVIPEKNDAAVSSEQRSYVYAQGSGVSCTVGASCDDGNACTAGEKYDSACICTGGAPVGEGSACGSGDQCDAFGKCRDCVNDGGCSDHPMSCDVNGRITRYVCDGPNECQPSNQGCSMECTFAACQGGVGCDLSTCTCQAGMVPDGDGTCIVATCTVGASCDDGNACTTGEKYNASCVCSGGTNCNDSNLCTNDVCTAGVGCSYPKKPEGTQCGATSFCTAEAECVNTEPPCPVGGICNDGNACTTGEKFNSACECVGGTTISCFDNNLCTADSCDVATGCKNVIQPGAVCGIGQVCDGLGECVSTQNCTPGDSCNDGDACNVGEIYDSECNCVGGTRKTCNDGNPCTTDSCSSGSGVCSNTNKPAGTSCDTGKECDGAGSCIATDTGGDDGACDVVEYATLRYGSVWDFYDDFINNGSCTATILGGGVSAPGIPFDFIGQDQQVGPNSTLRIFQSPPVQIDIKGSFEIIYSVTSQQMCGGFAFPEEHHKECAYYTTTRCGDGVTQPFYDEECDDENNTNGDGCSGECKVEPQENGQCGSRDGSEIYDTVSGGGELTSSTSGMCTVGSALKLTYDSSTRSWSRECGIFGGTGKFDVCGATEVYCGDDVQNGGEECDGEGQAQCSIGYVCQGCACKGLPVENGKCVVLSDEQRYDFDNAGDKLSGSEALCAGGTFKDDTFKYNPNSHTWTWTCAGEGVGATTVICQGKEQWCGDGIINGEEACDDGNTDPFDSCVTFGDAGIPLCKNPICGDGYLDSDGIDNTVGTSDDEQCDDGNTVDGDGCSAKCKLPQIPECSSSFNGQIFRVTAATAGTKVSTATPEACTVGWPVNVVYANGKYTWRCSIKATGASTEECTASETWCGDGTKDSGETCDRGDTDAKEGRGSANPGCSTLCEPLDKPLICGDPGYNPGPDGCNFGDPNDGIPDTACSVEYQLSGGADTCEYCKPDCTKGTVEGPYCGDGDVTNGEKCDDGNVVNDDACRNNCTEPDCGDGIKDPDEECNEPNLTCSSNETCNTTSCLCEPVTVKCGNGVRDNYEICDPNDPTRENRGTGEPGCSQQCTKINKEIVCGDGIRTPRGKDGIEGTPDDEECNEPGAVCEIRDICNPVTCQCEPKPMLCGNGVVDEDMGEQCDDGNMVDGDGCSAMCFPENIICGDGVKHPMEECEIYGQPANQCGENAICEYCDCVPKTKNAECASMFDGAIIYDPDNNGDGLTTRPQLCTVGNVSMFQYNPIRHEWSWQCVGSQGATDFCKATEQRCGDSKLQSNKGEQCDGEGQAQCGNGYSCRMCQCEYTPLCGNGIVDAGEQCDDGKNGRNTDGCTDECKNTICGDGVVQKPNGSGLMEWCDDGNTNNNDGCTNACETPYCGDGIVWEGKEQCDDGNRNDRDGCTNNCTISTKCGNGNKEEGETCDDGNKIPGDGCNAWCELESCGDGYLDKDGPDNQAGTADDEECEENRDCSGRKTCNAACDCVGEEPKCGDGKKDSGEECDDGNTVPGDGCFECKIEETTSKCISLAVSDTQVTVPYSLGYVCLGTGSVFNVKLMSSGQVLDQKNTKSGIFSITTPGTYQVECAVDGVTSPECKHTVTAGGYCEDLTVTTVGTGSQVPFTGSFVCDGVGSAFELVVVNSENQVVKKVTDTKKIEYSHLFEQPGTYTAHCFVDGMSSLSCEEGKLQQLIVGSGSTSQGTGGVEFPGGTGSLLNETSGYKAVDAFAEKRVNDLVQHFVRTINRSTVTRLNKGEVVLGSEVEALYKAIVVTESTIETVCENPCEAQLTGNTACGNGILEPEKGEECDDGNTVGGDKCSAYCEKEGGDGRSSSITCGNGKLDTGEECDDGNVRDGDGCSRFCRLQDKKETNKCGDGIVDKDEECDDGDDNGERSLCSSQCTLKGFKTVRTTDGSAPKCSFIDPPAVQVNGKDSEYLPFRWALEDDATVRRGNDSCGSSSDAGTIPLESMECHFTLQMADGTTHSFTRPCGDDSLREASWYVDLQADVGALSNSWGQSYLALKDLRITSYGEFALQLDKVTYDICTKETVTTEDGTSAEVIYKMEEKVYEQRVCQYNFPVTTPYFIQKGVSLSSRADDREKLANFKQLDGRTILDVSGIKPMSYASSRDTFNELMTQAEEYAQKATEFVTADHPFGSLGVAVKKLPAEEIYVTEGMFTLSQNGAAGVNDGKPTTLIVRGVGTVRIEGSLQGNILLLVPEGTVEFVNTDCDSNDIVQGIVVAQTITTSTQQKIPLSNNTLTSHERCVGGGLTIQGSMIGLDETALMSLKNARRSTLARWFEASDSLEEKIFNGAALRVEASASMWNALPPLAEGILTTLEITR